MNSYENGDGYRKCRLVLKSDYQILTDIKTTNQSIIFSKRNENPKLFSLKLLIKKIFVDNR